MASEYSVNISLDTKKAEAGLKRLRTQINDLNKPARTTKTTRQEEKIAKLKEAQRVSMVQTRQIGDQVQKAADLGLKVDKARAAIRRAAKADSAGLVKLSEVQRKAALQELNVQRKITEQLEKQKAASVLTGFGPKSPVFGRATQMSSAGNIASILQDPTTSASPVQQALAKMEERSAKNTKQAVLNRKKSLSLGKSIVSIKTKEANLDRKRAESLAKETELTNKKLIGASTGFSAAEYGPQFASSTLPTQSALNFDRRTGKLLRGPAGSGGGGLRNLGRRFDTQSALISGAFPLLFGQGPVGAAAGALGGGIGGMFGKMGGFAGGIAATAVVQQIQSAVAAISELGKALGPFTKNSEAALQALGLQGSAQEARIKLIERAQGKNAAFNATMQLMANRVGEEGVKALTNFGETTRLLNNQFATGVAKVQAFTASILNFLVKVTGFEKRLKEADVTQTLSDARAMDDPRAIALQEERQGIMKDAYRTTGHGGHRKTLKVGVKEALEELEAREAILATIINTEIEAATLTEKFDQAAKKVGEEREMTERIIELRREGLNPEIAKTIAELEKQAAKGKDALQAEIDKLKALEELTPLEEARLTTLEEQMDKIDEQIDGIKETEEATHDLNKAAIQTLDAFDSLKTTIQGDIKDGIKGLIKGTSTLADVVSKVADRFLDLAIDQAFGSFGGGGIFGFLGSIFKAKGGPVKGGGSYIVGEKGPELFSPGVSGMITPNHALGGSTNVVVNVDASGSSVEGDEQQGRELGKLISVAIQSELVKQKRPGGLLS